MSKVNDMAYIMATILGGLGAAFVCGAWIGIVWRVARWFVEL